MKSVLAALALAAGAVAQITLNTPTGALAAIQCAVYQITWTGGTGPFDIRLLDAGQNFLEDISSTVTSSPFPWTVNEPAGQSFILSIHDSVGGSGVTAPFTIQPSANTGCLGGSASASTGGSSTPASSASTSASGTGSSASVPATSGSTSASSAPHSSATAPLTTPVSTPHASPASSTSGSSSTASRAGAAASNSPSSGASALSAGVIGPVVAALFALAA